MKFKVGDIVKMVRGNKIGSLARVVRFYTSYGDEFVEVKWEGHVGISEGYFHDRFVLVKNFKRPKNLVYSVT